MADFNDAVAKLELGHMGTEEVFCTKPVLVRENGANVGVLFWLNGEAMAVIEVEALAIIVHALLLINLRPRHWLRVSI